MNDTYSFWEDAYRVSESAVIKQIIPNQGIIMEKTLFYPTSGGQPCDKGGIKFDDQIINVLTVKKIENEEILLVPEGPLSQFKVGMTGVQKIDWENRYKHMRMHTALHLLSVVIPLPVNGGQIGAIKSRLDFNMPDPIEDKQHIEDELNDLIQEDLKVEQVWIPEVELDNNPGLVKTMSVSPPRGRGDIRLIKISSHREQVDLQPCGGTHVKRTGEIGRIVLGKIEKKGKNNRRVNIHFVEEIH